MSSAMPPREVFFITGEPSADLHASMLATELLRRGDYRLTGAGGPLMRQAGVQIDFDSSDWATMGVVQTLLALMTISPDLSSQFGALVNLAVVTNVVPYIIALSALTVILQSARIIGGAYTRTIAITVVGIIYSVYALYAAGTDAVMGGMLVMGVGWLIWTFVAPTFMAKQPANAKA